MIAQIHGILVHKSLDHLIVDVNGVGYKVHIPLSTFYQLPEIDSTIKLNTYTHVREGLLQLYGFFTRQERDIFQLLIGVSGIGPRLAINILSGIPVGDICKALSEGNANRLSTAPGVGRKTAERMVLELRDKIGTIPFSEKPPIAAEADRGEVERDVISALINLGYKKAVAENALEMAKNTLKTDTSVLEDLLKEALRVLSKS
ncbi:MAG: Holliday junction branch migration protein RuvA [Deltaproteobacteria bacterium CG_4_9_14_3_um_filter_44_9]|nr:MAG: Holliday junction DNA helicase RuvA [Deltaproteobacteria bacterium CG2_30_43_15]PIU86647.1 MAG: Holliday junction branch migration protein RuvA [Deltaproteobacteria bacterium CG06_land_8_20_14_3_00_44_19]PIZ19589.1 MAG: Holliday junction branch migration protein RuvA [Deltaproteobacteria bacterium CG_4_10_14_0_8_um_filter_43_12]PJB41777.1 MAG: Holliday junction branch migration protein RuvA [Deltaproteobacteria bacterium CG_4_9_14_3_um_filter_44_9]HCX90524.1 Holliday junction branch mig